MKRLFGMITEKSEITSGSYSIYEVELMDTPPPPPPIPEQPILTPGPAPEERTWAMAAHLSAFVGHFIPFGHIIGPLVVWLVKRDSSDFVADQAKEALNAQISVTIYAAIAAVLILIVIGLPMLFLIWLIDIILIVVAAVNANDGRRYRYPLILRLVR